MILNCKVKIRAPLCHRNSLTYRRVNLRSNHSNKGLANRMAVIIVVVIDPKITWLYEIGPKKLNLGKKLECPVS